VGTLTATAAFAVVANAVTIWQAVYGDTAYYGLGFMAGAIVYFSIVLVRLEWATRRLPYLLLGRQAAYVPAGGVFSGFEKILTRIDKRVGNQSSTRRVMELKDGKKRAVRPQK
jgi:hypothetical protein